MSSADIQTRLRTLFDANKGIIALTTRLAKLPGDASLSSSVASLASATSQTSSSSEVRTELAAEIHQSLKDLEEDYEALTQDADEALGSSSTSTFTSARRRTDAQREQTRLALATQLERLGEDIKGSRALFRKAQLQAKRTEDAARRAERAALFATAHAPAQASESSSAAAPLLRRKVAAPKSGDELLVHAAGDVTLALRRTHALMQAELKRSEFAHETLQRSTAALEDLGGSYGSLGDVLGRSRSLIRTLRTSHKSDTWYLETALWILLATLAWLIFRRVAYYPLYYLAFAPLRAALRLVAAVVNVVVGVFVGGSKAAAASGTSLKIKPSATGKGAPRAEGMAAPSMHVGGGSKDEGLDKSDGPLSEEVGKMAEAGQETQETVLRERRPDEPVNPKKRMMEGPPPEKKDSRKDEL